MPAAASADWFRALDALPLGTLVGGWKRASPGVARWRDFPHHVLVLTTGGRGWYEDRRGRRADLAPGDVIALFPGTAHAFAAAPGATWDESYLIFGGAAFAAWFTGAFLAADRPVLPLGAAPYWQRRFAAVAPPHGGGSAYEAIARAHQLLADVVAAGGAAHAAPRATWLAQARDELLADDGRRPLAQVARRLGCSEQVFRKRFRALAGCAPGALREQARLETACRLLRDHPVATVAERLGYCDQFHFSRRFRQRYGLAPREFARAIHAR